MAIQRTDVLQKAANTPVITRQSNRCLYGTQTHNRLHSHNQSCCIQLSDRHSTDHCTRRSSHTTIHAKTAQHDKSVHAVLLPMHTIIQAPSNIPACLLLSHRLLAFWRSSKCAGGCGAGMILHLARSSCKSSCKCCLYCRHIRPAQYKTHSQHVNLSQTRTRLCMLFCCRCIHLQGATPTLPFFTACWHSGAATGVLAAAGLA
jgi:hypothetical protein